MHITTTEYSNYCYTCGGKCPKRGLQRGCITGKWEPIKRNGMVFAIKNFIHKIRVRLWLLKCRIIDWITG